MSSRLNFNPCPAVRNPGLFAESVEHDQPAHKCRLIVLYTLCCFKVDFCQGNSPVPFNQLKYFYIILNTRHDKG